MIGGTTGRPQESLLMYMVHLYRTAFRYFNMGYASAMAVVLFVVILAATVLIFRSTREMGVLRVGGPVDARLHAA